MIEVAERIPATVTTFRLRRMEAFQVDILPDVPFQTRGSTVLRVWRQQGNLVLIEACVSDHWYVINPRRWGDLLRELGDKG